MPQQTKRKKSSNQRRECDLPPYRPCIDSYRIPGFIPLPPPPRHNGMPSTNCPCEDENYCTSETCHDSESCHRSKPKFCSQNQPAKEESIDEQRSEYESNKDSSPVTTELKFRKVQHPGNEIANDRKAPGRLLQAPTSSSRHRLKDSSAVQSNIPIQTSFTSYTRETDALRVPRLSRCSTATSANGPSLPLKSTHTPTCCIETGRTNGLLAPSVSTRSSESSTGCPGCNVIAPEYLNSPVEDGSFLSEQSSQSNLCRAGCRGQLAQAPIQPIFRETRNTPSPAKRDGVYNDATNKICRAACNIPMTQIPTPTLPGQQRISAHKGFAKQSSRPLVSPTERRISNYPIQCCKVSGNIESAGSAQVAKLGEQKSFDSKSFINSKTHVPTSALDSSKGAETANHLPSAFDSSKNVDSTKTEEFRAKVEDNNPNDTNNKNISDPIKTNSRSSKGRKPSQKRAKENVSNSSSRTSNKSVKKKKKSKTLIDVTLSCATTTDCFCHYPPQFKQFTCTGNLSGNCNCSPNH